MQKLEDKLTARVEEAVSTKREDLKAVLTQGSGELTHLSPFVALLAPVAAPGCSRPRRRHDR